MTMTRQVNNSHFVKAWEALDSSGAPLLWDWRQETAKTKPYEGLKIYHNIPLSIETICKLEALCISGAEVVVSSTDLITPATFPEARAFIESVGLEYRENKHADEGEFDFYLDCCAELSDLPPPRYGAVELTRTGALAYQSKNVPFPVISVDDSYLKALETFNGTGESFLRAFCELTNKDPSKETFAIIGYGKVGQGITHWINSIGGQVVIFDIDPNACKLAASRGFDAYSCGTDANVESLLNDVTVVVTATGLHDILKRTFSDATDQLAGKIICNMGADNEIGEGFSGSDILAGGAAINFTLRHPTIMRYLDPSFYAHNLSIQLLKDGSYTNGFHPFPKKLDLSIVNNWAKIHNESIDHIVT